jgi:hypothetical protein
MISKKLERFTALSFKDKVFFLQVFLLLSFSKLVILLVPFRKVAPHLGMVNGNINSNISPADQEAADRVKLFIYMVGGNLPWASVCLDQAMTCMILLNKRKIPGGMYLGVKKNELEKKLDAHAWVLCGGNILIGGERSRNYQVAAWFANKY